MRLDGSEDILGSNQEPMNQHIGSEPIVRQTDAQGEIGQLAVGKPAIDVSGVREPLPINIYESVATTPQQPELPNPETGQVLQKLVKKKTSVNRQYDGDPEDLMRAYLSESSEYELLTKKDETELAQQIEAGREARLLLEDSGLSTVQIQELGIIARLGDEATSKFIHANFRLVVSIAKRYKNTAIPLIDLVQEGNIGMMHAVEKFDRHKGFKFSTYASWWIRQAITRCIDNTGKTIRLPIHAGGTLKRVSKAQTSLEAQLGRKPTNKELAEYLGVEEDKVSEVLAYPGEPISLSLPLSTDGVTELKDVIADRSAMLTDEVAVASMVQQATRNLLGLLDEDERQILTLRHGLDGETALTATDIAKKLGYATTRIRHLEDRAYAKLRHPTVKRGAQDLLYS